MKTLSMKRKEKNANIKRILVVLVFVFGGFQSVRAQQDPMFSQYMFNGLFLNPAYAGTQDHISSSLTFRNQWISMPGAPKTFLFGIDSPVQRESMGVGLVVSNDAIGIIGATDIAGIYSYRIRTSKNTALTFGVKAGVVNFRESLQDADFHDGEDDLLNGPNASSWHPKVGFGAYYYKQDKYYIGFSVPTILSYDKDRDFSMDVNTSSFFKRHFYLTGGYVFNYNRNIKIKPFTLIKYIPNAPLQVDLNVSTIFYDKYGIGLGYRIDKESGALSILGQVQINKMFRAGFAYVLEMQGMNRYLGGSQEIMLGIDFGKKAKKRYRSIRSF